MRSNAAQNFGATITGSLNSIESKTASSNYSGVANSIIGVANREFNANGALIFGAGNEITNSVADIYSAPTSGGNSPKELQQRLMIAIKAAESGGSTMAIGGGNKADYTQKTQITGVNNTVTGTADTIAKLNYVSGFKNTVTNASNNIVMGNDHTVTADNTVAIGGLSGADARSVANTTSIGYDAKVNQEGGVALGYKSNATVDKGAAGYDPTTGTASTETNSTWKATSAAVSVGDVGNGITRQITSVAAGIADTDAVNVAQLKQAVAGASNRINKLGDRVDRVGAGAAALAALHPQDFDPDDKWDFAAGYGNYKGAHAVAVGAFYRPNEDTTFSVGGSFGGGENMVNVGVSWKLGQKNTISRSRVSIAKDMLAMKNQIEVLTKKLESYESGKPAGAVSVSAGAITFPDVPENHWAYAYVKSLADKGYLQGYPDGEFKGDRAMTRYEYAAIIYRALQNGAPSDGTMARSVDEFGPELVKVQNIDRFRVDRISGKDNDRNKVERVRINDKDNAEKNDYRDVYGSRIAK